MKSVSDNLPRIAIIGAGKVGQSLAQLFESQHFTVDLVGRSFIAQQAACQQADITLITVNDSNIKRVCDVLANSFKPGSVVAHCSGALASNVLHNAKQQLCHIASAHPLNTFPNVAASLSTFSTTEHASHCYSEGDAEALTSLQMLFERCGFTFQTIDTSSKALYHAACVFACNYLNSLMDMSLSTAEAAGLDRHTFWQALQPILDATLTNINEQGVAKALSGPIARGDADTVASHLMALEDESFKLKNSYVDLGLRALSLAIKNDQLSDQQASTLKKLLTQN